MNLRLIHVAVVHGCDQLHLFASINQSTEVIRTMMSLRSLLESFYRLSLILAVRLLHGSQPNENTCFPNASARNGLQNIMVQFIPL